MNSLRVEKMELGPIATNAFLLWEENGKYVSNHIRMTPVFLKEINGKQVTKSYQNGSSIFEEN